MSTAGKVLIVVVMLLTIVWVMLSAGLSRINTNHNTKVFELAKQVEKLQEEVAETQEQVASLLTQTQHCTRENRPRAARCLRAKQIGSGTSPVAGCRRSGIREVRAGDRGRNRQGGSKRSRLPYHGTRGRDEGRWKSSKPMFRS